MGKTEQKQLAMERLEKVYRAFSKKQINRPLKSGIDENIISTKDALQNAFFKIMIRIDKGEVSKDEISGAFMQKVFSDCLIDIKRDMAKSEREGDFKKEDEKSNFDIDGFKGEDKSLERFEREQLIHYISKKLKHNPKSADFFNAFFVEGMTYQEISEAWKVNERTVRNQAKAFYLKLQKDKALYDLLWQQAYTQKSGKVKIDAVFKRSFSYRMSYREERREFKSVIDGMKTRKVKGKTIVYRSFKDIPIKEKKPDRIKRYSAEKQKAIAKRKSEYFIYLSGVKISGKATLTTNKPDTMRPDITDKWMNVRKYEKTPFEKALDYMQAYNNIDDAEKRKKFAMEKGFYAFEDKKTFSLTPCINSLKYDPLNRWDTFSGKTFSDVPAPQGFQFNVNMLKPLLNMVEQKKMLGYSVA